MERFKNEALTDFSEPKNRARMKRAIAKVESELGRTYDIIVGGLRKQAPETFKSINPADENQVVGVFQKADQLGIRYIIRGTNLATEAIMPIRWSYSTQDFAYIKSVHKLFGQCPLKKYPHFSFLKLQYYRRIKKLNFYPILNLVSYNKKKAMDVLQNKLGWVYYGGKHYESIYTRFWQGYVLPVKFNIDKRRYIIKYKNT